MDHEGAAGLAWTEVGRPFDHAGLGDRLRPFAVGAVAGVAAVGLGVPPDHGEAFLLGAFLSLVAVIAALVVPWAVLPKAWDVSVPMMYVASVGLLRHGAGGSESGFSVLVLLPVIWTALYGSGRQVIVILGSVAAVLVLPILVVGGLEYPQTEWRRLAMVLLVSILVVTIIRGLVASVRRSTRAAADHLARLTEQTLLTKQVIDSASDAVITIDPAGAILEANPAAARLSGRELEDMAGTNAVDVILAPAYAERAHGALRLLASGERAPFSFDAELKRPDGVEVPIEARLSASGPASARRLHAFVRDLSDRRAAEARVQEHLDDLHRILAAGRLLTSSTDRGQARGTVCETARSLAGADLAIFFERDPSTGVISSTGSSDPDLVDIELDRRVSVTATVFDRARPHFVPELTADPRADHAAARAIGVTTGYWQPVMNGHDLVGVVTVYWKAPHESPDDRIRSLLEVLATQVAGTLAREALLERVNEMARTDTLTGLLNRRAMKEVLDRDLAAAVRGKGQLSIALLDLDHFKQFNDRFGHQGGDRLLASTAASWKAELRSMDTLARYGGEEFLAILPGSDATTAVGIADRLRSAVPENQTISVGVAAWDGSETAEALIGRADAALYEAKRGGRDRIIAAGDTGLLGPDHESGPPHLPSAIT